LLDGRETADVSGQRLMKIYEMDWPYKHNMDFADSKNPRQPERNRFV
jgi:hypothetical protein